jgi:hypothetical protein
MPKTGLRRAVLGEEKVKRWSETMTPFPFHVSGRNDFETMVKRHVLQVYEIKT